MQRKGHFRAQQASDERLHALQARYKELQTQEDDLLLQISQAKQPGVRTGAVSPCTTTQIHKSLGYHYSRVT